MRDFLDGILSGIGVSSLTDEEWNFPEVQALSVQDFSIANYRALLLVLNTREDVSGATTRLRYGFMAHGTEIDPLPKPASEIFIGSPL